MEKDWVKIRTYINSIEAEIVCQMLIENDIPAVVLNKQDSSYHFGKIELYVGIVNKDAAENLINENEGLYSEEVADAN